MKFSIIALVASLAAADDWFPSFPCLTYWDEQARWLAKRADCLGVTFFPKGFRDWDDTTRDTYCAQIAAINDAPNGDLSEENRAVARQLLEGLDWVDAGSDEVLLPTIAGWPTYDGDYAANCVEPITSDETSIISLEN